RVRPTPPPGPPAGRRPARPAARRHGRLVPTALTPPNPGPGHAPGDPSGANLVARTQPGSRRTQGARMRNPMFVYDEHLADLIFDYCRRRLALDPVPLDFGGARESLDTVLDGLVGAGGNEPEHVLEVFGRLAEAVVSCDSPRFLSFIPAAPTKAALLFDMVVS